MPSFESEVRKERTISGVNFETIRLEDWNEDDKIVTGWIYEDQGNNTVKEQRVIIYDVAGTMTLKKII